ncbi:ATP-binding protein [Marinobacter sp. ANT_B65]|uniref:hybrid sensor histidine kinase/response regulator n=1 Tax=Marinobacter sp. ANT_B65 TaxID=2039467 RepID=UPI000BBE8EC5|nr:ATP-binding protein [Marinobacter sp. ANT_B65]PCM46378.1 hybrid sensor histidine kinase/response regulator [Marinobacter sp. ANT_B65]
MIRGLKHRLSYRLTRDTVLIAMVLGLVLNAVQITLDYFSARNSMEADVQALMEISHNPAAQIAYNIDVRLAKELLDGLLRHPATIDARIVDSRNNTMAAASTSSPVSPCRWISDQLFGATRVFSQELSVSQLKNLPLGQLVVTIDTYHYGLQFLERATYTLVSGLLKSLILSMSLLVIFYLILTRPLLSVISALIEVKASSPEKIRLPVPQGHQHDEIGTMVGIINQHLETIDSSLAQLRTAKSAMKNYSSELEHDVESRTREISDKNKALQRGNRALVKAKEDAMRRARARANFLASMSHEIRTPLNGVLGMLGLVLEGEQDSAKRHRLQIALSAGESLLGILNDILDISKVEAGKLNLENIPVDIRGLIDECATLHTQHARKKGIDLIAETDLNFPNRFLGDPTRLRQIVNNLLSNAIKFTDTGNVRITASYSAGTLTIDVSDTGIGMSKEGLRRIFSPFSQAATQTTRLYGGTGLGLTLCRQLVERMHGEITVESKEQQGTRFTVSLPLPVLDNRNTEDPQQNTEQLSGLEELPDHSAARLPPALEYLQVSSSNEPETTQQSGLRILLVEDNEVNQMVASTLLRKMGHHADVAENGELAIEALGLQHYDLVLMDCQMPVMDGFETTRLIRKNPQWSELPIIAVTANVMQGDRDDCLACGMNDYITKPYSRSQLNAAIMRWTPPPAPQ